MDSSYLDYRTSPCLGSMAERQLTKAAKHETKTEEVLVEAEANYELATERRFNKEKLVRSITSVISRLR